MSSNFGSRSTNGIYRQAGATFISVAYPLAAQLGSDLINLLQLSTSGNGASNGFQQAAINEAAERARTVRFERAAGKLSRFWRWRMNVQTPRDAIEFASGLVLLFSLCYILTVAFPTWSSAMDRLLSPWQFMPQQGATEILEVTPGDADILAGSRLEITARIANPEREPVEAALFYTIEGQQGEAQTAMFANDANDSFTFSFPAVFEPLRYRLEIGDSQTVVYTVALREKPTVQEVEVTYEYPPYLGRPNETVQQKHADLDAPQFTIAHLKLACSSELSEGHAMIEGVRLAGGVAGRTLTLDIPLTKQTSYTIHLTGDRGLTDAEPRVNMIRVVPDAPPTLQLVKPARESSVAPGTDVPVVVVVKLFAIRDLPFGDAQFLQPCGDVGTVRTGADGGVDVQNLAVLADDECPASGVAFVGGDQAVGFRCGAAGIAEDRIVQLQRFRKPLVRFGVVTTGGEISNVEFLQGVGALTERHTFLRSAARKCFRIPGDNNSLALQVRQFVRFAVAAGHFKIGSGIADFQFRAGVLGKHHRHAQRREGQNTK